MVQRPYPPSALSWGKTILFAKIQLAVALVASSALASNRETPVVKLVRDAAPSVVNIHGHKTIRANSGGHGHSFQQVNGMGTGVVIDPRGYVITNFHVVQDVNDIRIALSDGRPAIARVVAHDLRTDLALLKIDTNEQMPVIKLGSSEDLWVGETVVAIGNAYGYEHTVTQGIISALHRDVPVNEEQHYTDLIQTSAEINPGNSGGPLLNLDGQMIGINVAVRVGAQGIAFTIPVDQVLDIVSNLIQQKVGRRFYHGVQGRTRWVEEDESRFEVTSVAAGSAADKHGIIPGDQILQVNGRSVRNHLDFELSLLEVTTNSELKFEVANSDGEVGLVSLQQRRGSSTTPRLTGVNQRIWTSFGIQGEPVTQTTLRSLNAQMDTTYEAGLKLTSIRKGSVAAMHGLESGDILLGIRNWQTASMNDLDFILRQDEVRSGEQSQFFIVRAKKTMIGTLQLASSNRRTQAR